MLTQVAKTRRLKRQAYKYDFMVFRIGGYRTSGCQVIKRHHGQGLVLEAWSCANIGSLLSDSATGRDQPYCGMHSMYKIVSN